jgi:hypothetical protein
MARPTPRLVRVWSVLDARNCHEQEAQECL